MSKKVANKKSDKNYLFLFLHLRLWQTVPFNSVFGLIGSIWVRPNSIRLPRNRHNDWCWHANNYIVEPAAGILTPH